VNWIDWLTIALVLVSGVRGARYGFWVVLFDAIFVIVGFLAASAAYLGGGEIVTQYLQMVPPSWGAFIAFVVVWAVVYFPLSWLTRRLLRDVPFPASEITGAMLGAARGFLLATVVLVVALAAPFRVTVQRDADNSLLATYLLALNSRAAKELPNLPVDVPQIGPGGKTF
jgi:uncharacterized membrane protein required for colicin V production